MSRDIILGLSSLSLESQEVMADEVVQDDYSM